MFHDMSIGGMWFGWIVWVVVIIIVVIVIIKYTSSQKPINENISSSSPMDILKKRYAKGEISKEEYENVKKDLVQ